MDSFRTLLSCETCRVWSVWQFLTAFVQLCFWFEGQAGSNGAGPEICMCCSHGDLQYINDAIASSPSPSVEHKVLLYVHTETVGLLGTEAQIVHLDFQTAPQLCLLLLMK